ncbi:hypothetical protein [Oceanobacillus kimchii]|uniref:hypothetical protein n=1 Tax=Oceanobacillus kimchii TaxID=746691 RepID=UPI003B022E12
MVNDSEKLLRKMQDDGWKQAIEILRNFECKENHVYKVIYKQGRQTKEREFQFNIVKKIDNDYILSFIDEDESLINPTKLKLNRLEIEKIEVEDYSDFEVGFFYN